jgi:histidine triad (HIT) family protein
MSDCIFCGIAAGTMPAERVHEDERTVAFLDIFPACDGHVLVIPRAHADDIHSLDPADVAAVAQTAQIMAGRVSGALGTDGVSIVQSNGAAAGQTVFHYHVHVIPRFAGDGVLQPWTPGHASAEELTRMGALLRGE